MISLEEYFIDHGAADLAPRTVRPFHRQVLTSLNQVISGELPDGKRDLLINIAPRHGKTFMARDFVSYGLGNFPDSQWIYTSYGADLAGVQTRAIRDVIPRPWYQSFFPNVHLDQSAADYFTTTAGGQVFGVGAGGGVTGYGAGRKRKEFGGAIVIDDPLKSDDRKSKAALDHCREWYTGVLKNRKNSANTPTVAIMQPLHPDDLTAYIKKYERDTWHIISIPALQEDGTAIWPETISAADLLHLKEVDPDTFYAQYQQQPQQPGGNMIKREWWHYYAPQTYDVNGLVFMTADTAMKAKDKNDCSSLQCWCANQDYLDLLEDKTGRWEFPDLMRHAIDFWRKWEKFGTNAMYIEDKASGPSLIQMLRQQGIPAKPWAPKEYNFPDDKIGRVKCSLWYIEAGRVRLPTGEPFVEPLIEECCAFTGDDGAHDDRVDALTCAVSIWSWKAKGAGIVVPAGIAR